ncbi:acyl-[ACP]--phospholipid O-acyltransferase [Candidatus Halobeggiatoa sp. HSG11]|nr:acyl-[ACP]--phospholipid O-acyltransferase [Candidatus Halobeggiatoa sp. HSG11]
MWKSKGFVPYLTIVFFNAFTDLGHKIIIQNALFKFYDGTELRIYTAIIQAMILIPFVMVFTPAGFLSDKFPKNRVIQFATFAAIPITIIITWCYYNGEFWLAFWMTFILALQSAFYSPAKYGYIRELVGKNNLTSANSAVQSVTIVAILAGIAVYSVFFESLFVDNFTEIGDILVAVKYVGFLLIAGIILEALLSLRLPKKQETNPELHFDVKKYLGLRYFRDNLKGAWLNQGIWLSIIGLAVFWAINQTILAAFPAHLKDVIGETDTRVANGIMALAGIGIVFGAAFVSKVSKNYIETGLIPLGALGICIALLIIPSLQDSITSGVVFLVYGFFGAMFIVPLNALIQYYAKEGEIGMILSANNFIQNIFMLAFLGITIGLAYIEFSNQNTFYLLAIVTFVGTMYSIVKLPQSFIRYVITGLLRRRYQVQVVGMKNLPSTGGVLLLGNHVSWLDWAMLQIASPRQIRFVMLRSYYEKWYMKWFLNMFQVIPIGATGSKQALQKVHDSLSNGEVVAIFPEGHISHNGHLSIFKAGFERAVKDTQAVIVPFYLRGLWGSYYSYATKKYRYSTGNSGHRLITVGFGEALPSSSSAGEVKQAVLKTSIHAWQEYGQILEPLPISFLRTAKAQRKKMIVMDATTELSYERLLTASLVFAKQLQSAMQGQQNIGLLLPTSAGATIANLAVLINGKTVVNLNYTAPPKTVELCMERADIKTILTSKRFLKKLGERGVDMTPLQDHAKFIYLEDVKAEIPKLTLLLGLLKAKFLPVAILKAFYFQKTKLEDTAAILFSSGSEGVPKGVQLTHANIMVNIKQVISVLNPTDDEVVLNSLPIFHAFGLTVTTFMPLMEGIPMVCQPDPTDAKTIGSLVARYQVTILVGTSTFFRIYTRNKKLHPLMFESLRFVVAGAERLNPDVRNAFKEKFGKDMYEGYGATETTPVASCNLPDILLSYSGTVQVGNKIGTVGLPIPGTTIKIVDPDSLEELAIGEAGLILIGGPQIMLGYLKDEEKTAAAVVEKDGVRWYKTGDKGKIDADGYLTILDRYSRFAKLGGEMISLTAIEVQIAELINDEEVEILAVAIPDSAKGEQVILLVAGEIDVADLKSYVLKSDINPLMLPKQYLAVEAIPKLGTGKADFSGAKKLVLGMV